MYKHTHKYTHSHVCVHMHCTQHMIQELLLEWGPFQGLRAGSCLTLNSELSKETHVLKKQETLLGRGPPGLRVGEQGRPEGLLCHVAHSLGFYGDGLVSRLSLANHSELGSFLAVHTSLSQDRFQREGSWGVGRTSGISF